MNPYPRNRFQSSPPRQHSNIRGKRFVEDVQEYDPISHWDDCVRNLANTVVITYQEASEVLMPHYRYALESGISGEAACEFALRKAQKEYKDNIIRRLIAQGRRGNLRQ